MVNRIRELLDARQLSPTQFADLIGVGRPVISHILSERNKPSLEVVQKILDAFPDVSLSWLMKGNGPMLTNAVPPTVAASALAQATPPVQAVPIEAAPLPAAPAPLPAPAAIPNAMPQPQAFTTFSSVPASTARPAATPSTPRPLPPKFRLEPKRAAVASPLPTEEAALLPAEPATMAPVAPVVAAPAPAAFAALPLATTPPVAPAALDSKEPTGSAAEYLPVAAPQLVQPAPGQVPVAPVAVISTPPAVEPLIPNPAAALSFLGEPGKAIRRIVIFYRDGSFSDYVPEGQ
jgi:transcriptional regulator with XRE-family HTH domain